MSRVEFNMHLLEESEGKGKGGEKEEGRKERKKRKKVGGRKEEREGGKAKRNCL